MRLLPLLPLLLLSVTLALAQETDPFAKWEKSMAEFAAADQKAIPAKQSVLFVGSSSIRMWDLEESWPDTETINRGFGGSTLADSVHFFDQVIKKYQPRAIAIYAGDNDLKKGLTVEETVADFSALKAKIDEALPGTPVIYIAIKPSLARWNLWPQMAEANAAIQAICDADTLYHFADIATPMLADEQPPPDDLFIEDGLHLSQKGYAMWQAVIDPLIPPVRP